MESRKKGELTTMKKCHSQRGTSCKVPVNCCLLLAMQELPHFQLLSLLLLYRGTTEGTWKPFASCWLESHFHLLLCICSVFLCYTLAMLEDMVLQMVSTRIHEWIHPMVTRLCCFGKSFHSLQCLPGGIPQACLQPLQKLTLDR